MPFFGVELLAGLIPDLIYSTWAVALRKATAHVEYIKSGIKPAKSSTPKKGIDRERNIVNMYNNNYTIDDIWKVSGFRSRSSVFRILNKYGVKLNRGKFSGPLGKRKPKNESENEFENE